MKRNLTRLILIFTILFNILTFSVYSSDENYDAKMLEKARNLLEVTEIMEVGNDSGTYTETLSRAEFAVYLANLFGVDSSQKNNDRYFIDVPMDHWAINSINFLYNRGILTLNDSRTFLPDLVVTKDEAYKMVVEAIGYGEYAENTGGFPSGYRIIADRMEISKGVSNLEMLTIADAAIILANTLIAPTLEGVVYSDENVKYTDVNTATLLEIYHSIYIIDEQITGVPGISISGDSSIPVGKIKLGNDLYYCSLANVYDYIGYMVRAYCKKDDKKESGGEIVLIEDRGRTNKKTVFSEDFTGFDSFGYKLEYTDDETQRYISVSKGISVVKNGVALNDNIDSVFNINKGRIELLDTNNDNIFEYAMVWEYANLLVSYIDYDEQIIYDKFNTGPPLKYGLTEVEVLRIFDEKGRPALAESIKLNSLLTIYKSAAYLEIHICPEAKSETIVSLDTTGDDGPYAEIADSAGNKHIALFDKDYYKTDANSIMAGMSGVFYYDLYGKIAYINRNRKDNVKFGFLIDYNEGRSINPTLKLKILTEDNICQALECNDTVEIDGTPKKSISSILTALDLGKSGISGQVITYKQNIDGKIISIDTTYEGESLTQTATAEEKRFTYASRNFGPLTIIGTNTVCFGVPAEANLASASDEDFLVLPISWFESDLFYTVETYKLEKDSGYEDILVCRGDFENAKTVKSLFVVGKIYEILNNNGIAAECVEGYTNGIKYTYMVHEGKSIKDMGVESGDVLFLILDAKGDISDYIPFYDYNNKKLSNQWSSTNEYNTYYNSNYMAYGNVLSTKDGVIKIGRTSLDTIDIVAPCENIPITLCEEINGKIVCSMGRVEDIVGYDVSNTDYSRVFIKMNYGAVKEIVILK